ncbi:zinc-ribbon domain-containing protein [Actinomadura viridis]|uniref:Tellurite resistance protein n=1 Tax=Actinomadura viridis TaxID=58110 RepID=A0A931DI85_9ACTN|nr:zinc-ribbon domain-containing protein [Actinomadura viridis]MBG6088036.1 tellurite resistance protein [Actinomadura viridis]
MLLIFGLSVFFRTVSEGTFHCPRCGGDRAYRRRVGRRWFTLFFLPVIPFNQVGEVVECRTCRTRFDIAVLQSPTARQMAAALPAGMRAAAALVLRAGGAATPAARARAAEAVHGYGGTGYDDAAVEHDLRLGEPFLEEEIAAAGAQLAPEAKEWFLAQAVRVGLADGPLGDAERRALHRVAHLLGMSPAHALGVIVTTEGAAR